LFPRIAAILSGKNGVADCKLACNVYAPDRMRPIIGRVKQKKRKIIALHTSGLDGC
jgi:hypothetical protein